MSSDFTKLIHSLKQDIQTVGGAETVLCETLKSDIGDKSTVGCAPLCDKEPKWLYHPATRVFVERFMVSTEFFLFFVVLLSILRPSFLYKNVKQTRGNNTVIIVPQFSFLYLVVYSGIFTGCLNLLMFLQKKALRALNR